MRSSFKKHSWSTAHFLCRQCSILSDYVWHTFVCGQNFIHINCDTNAYNFLFCSTIFLKWVYNHVMSLIYYWCCMRFTTHLSGSFTLLLSRSCQQIVVFALELYATQIWYNYVLHVYRCYNPNCYSPALYTCRSRDVCDNQPWYVSYIKMK